MSRPAPGITEPCARPDHWLHRLVGRFVGVDNRKSALAAAHRRAVPIMACVGANGGGKSLAAVYTVLPTLRGVRWACTNPDHLHTHGTDCAARRLLSTEARDVCDCATTWTTAVVDGRPAGYSVTETAPGGVVEGWRTVLSTVALFTPDGDGDLSPHYVPLRSFVQLLAVEHADVVMDEVTGVASSRQSMSLPPQVENLIAQLRRRDARLIWTTPDYGAADLRIRQVTQGVVFCRGSLATAPDPATGRVWSESRLFRWALYDAKDFDQFTAGKREKLKPQSVQQFWRPGHVVERTYSTLAAVTMLGVSADGGMCLSCGGGRSRPKCSCPTDPDRLPPGVVEETTAAGLRKRRLVDLPPPRVSEPEPVLEPAAATS